MNTKISEGRDFFTDSSVLRDPYAYLDAIRSQSPVGWLTNRDVVMVTGFAEAVQVLMNTKDFSSVIAAAGPTAPLPFEPQGDDLTEQIAAHHHQFVGSEQFISYDGARHSASRSLLTPLFTPSRLRANEEYMRSIADQMVTKVVAKGACELVHEVGTPYVTLVIADLLGVPAEDRKRIQQIIASSPTPGSVNDADSGASLEYLCARTGELFGAYFADRRANPRNDLLTLLATAKFPDGSTPDQKELITLATFLFAAGQDTSAKLLGNSMRYLAEDADMQRTLRADRSLIPAFLEEMLRLEGSTKGTARLAKRNTRVGDLDIPAGTKLSISLAGANRDPRRWENPNTFQLHRPKITEHLAFSRGAHTCIGAPLARAEIRVLLDRFFEHTSGISLSEQHHGPPGKRKLDYEPSYIIRGLERLHIELTPR
jgi:cytochrome P450